jgi:hypothetical protein
MSLATLAIVDGPAAAGASAPKPGGPELVAAASPLPGVSSRIESCLGSGFGQSATSLAGCARWAKSGPINVVLLSSGPENPYQETLAETKPRWKPAQGGWLVARVATRGCGAGWRASEQQVELRLSAVARHHYKFIRPGCRWQGKWLTVGEAHTDAYDVAHCGGDHITSLDQARDALVASLTDGGVVSRVEHRRWNPAGTTFPDGCGHPVLTDGMVAYVWLLD